MSLINEALKKAQKQRAHEPLSSIPVSANAQASPRVIKRKEPMPAKTLVVVGALCVILVVALGAGGWYVFKESSTQIAASSTNQAASSHSTDTHPAKAGNPSPADPAIATVSLQQTAAPGTSAATPAGVTTVANAATTTTSVISPANSNGAGPSTLVASSTPAGVPPSEQHQPQAASATPTPAPAPVDVIQITAADLKHSIPPNPQALAVVDTFKVSGIRASASDPKVLLNDRVFRLNDIVERTYGLKLTEVHADRLLFVDDAGATYTKTF